MMTEFSESMWADDEYNLHLNEIRPLYTGIAYVIWLILSE